MGKIIMNGKEYIGSGGGGSLTMLSNSTIISLNTPISLADDITNYDLILVHAYYTGGAGYPLVATQVFAPSQLIAHNRQTWLVGGNADRMLQLEFTTNTTVKMINSNGSNGIQGIYGIKFYGNSTNDRHDYSTVEKVIGTWIDGKPLYEITIPINSFSYGSAFTVAHGISNLDKVVETKGKFYRGDEGSWNPIPFIYPANPSSWGIQDYNYKSTVFSMFIGSGFSASQLSDMSITIKYTKTTD